MGKIKRRIRLLLFLLWGILISYSYAQETIVLRGKVVDFGTKTPIIGAIVILKGSPTGTITSADGTFSLQISNNLPAVLNIRYLGYQDQEINVYEADEYLNLELLENANLLNEVVIIGYGKQKRSEIIGSVSVVNSEKLANRPITNSTQALQGTNGIYVNQTNGRPGADGATIRIRGVGTLNNNDPLVLVDGIEFPLSNINPNDIESITVLKDAASAAIYGNRAANGVVLVKTKNGSKGKSQIEYSGYIGIQSATFVPKVVINSLDYMIGKNLAFANEGKPAEYSDEILNEFRTGTDPYIYPNTDWFDIMYKDAAIQEHNLRFSGGNESGTYSVSLGYLDQDGILLNTWARRYSANISIDSEINKYIKIGGIFSETFLYNRDSAYTSNDGNGEGGVMGLLYRGLPIQVPYAKDGTYSDQWIRVPGHNFFRNPLALSYEGFKKTNTYRTLTNIFAEIKLPFGIYYKITGGANILYGKEKYAYPIINLTHPKTGVITPMGNIPARGIRDIATNAINLTNFHTLTYDHVFNNHSISALGGFSLESFTNGSLTGYNQGYLGNDLTELNAGSTSPSVSGTSQTSRLASYFGRIHYSYKEKYLLESNFRYDGSSRFASDRRWGFFPSFSAGWVINKERFFKEVNWVDNLKFRASWGELGNQNIALYSYINSISLGQNYSFNGTVVGGTAITQLSDPTITWETTSVTDIGFDLDILKSKLSVQFDWYDKRTRDILWRVSVPAQVGNLNGPFKNIGSLTNTGVEFTVNYYNHISNFNYNIGGNIAYLKNKVTNLNRDIYYEGVTIVQEGYPVSSFYGLQAEGIFKTEDEVKKSAYISNATQPGDIKYKNVDDSNDIIDNNDRVVIGNNIPKYTYSFVLGGSYKGLDLQLFFQGVQDVDTYVSGNLAQPYRNGAGVTPEWLTDSWTPEKPNAPLPRLTTPLYTQNFQTSSYWIQDASYLRLKNIQLSYELPKSLIKNWNLSKIKLFVNGQNLLTFSEFVLGDPERNLTRNNMIDYPIAKTISGGVNITF
jgi:TonB-linked SusC/RagA family outer membrane protein